MLPLCSAHTCWFSTTQHLHLLPVLGKPHKAQLISSTCLGCRVTSSHGDGGPPGSTIVQWRSPEWSRSVSRVTAPGLFSAVAGAGCAGLSCPGPASHPDQVSLASLMPEPVLQRFLFMSPGLLVIFACLYNCVVQLKGGGET